MGIIENNELNENNSTNINPNNNKNNEISVSSSNTSISHTTQTNSNLIISTSVSNVTVKSNKNNNTSNHSVNPNNSVSDRDCDMASLDLLQKCHQELFPKKNTTCDDEKCLPVAEQLPILNGEYIQFIGPSGKANDETLLLTNYRLFLLMHDSTSFINLPVMLIESIEVKDIFFIYIYLKVAKTIRILFSCNEKAVLWANRINSSINRLYKLEELFSFTFYLWHTNERQPDESTFAKNDQSNLIYREFKRMKFDPKIWRLSEVNKKYELCSTYPETVIVPRCINDEQLKKIACFRSSKRFPAVVWRSRKTGAVLARSSQPNVGLLAWRLNEDELLLKALADCCSLPPKQHHSHHSSSSSSSSNHHSSKEKIPESNNSSLPPTSTSTTSTTTTTTTTTTNTPTVNGSVDAGKQAIGQSSTATGATTAMLLIIDARFRSVALANRVKGGGYEYSEYYTNCEIQFMNLENIHVIRSSFQSLRLLCQSIIENKTFLSQLEASKWLQHLSGIIKAACTVTASVDQLGKPVLVHCSDGWDRTPQILGLAKLLLDPHYRTIEGLRTVIEVEWLAFGHKFAQRNGHANHYNDVNERCPVFLQWLDCVYQITRQFPSAFQFNELCLLKLCYHAYSCLFGTFLCDSALERAHQHTDERTFSVWSYLSDKNREIVNHRYDDTYTDVLYPNYELAHLQLWQRLFCESDVTYLVKAEHARQHLPLEWRNGGGNNFNDSIDGCLYGSSPVDFYSAASLAEYMGSGGSAAVDGNNSISTLSINHLLKNAIDTNVSLNRSSGNLNKSRSFDDLTKVITTNNNNMSSGGSASINVTTSTTTKMSVAVSDSVNNGDPVVQLVRSNSESNLLLDALKSASPKSNGVLSFHFSKANSTTVESTSPPLAPPLTSQTSPSNNNNENEQLLITSNNNDEQTSGNSSPPMSTSEASSSPSPSPLDSAAAQNHNQHNPLLMQNSTETLVDEAQLLLNKLSVSATAATQPLQQQQLNLDTTNTSTTTTTTTTTNNNNYNNNKPAFTASSNPITSASECSTPSTLPSPTTVHSVSVSTSTSGLNEYIEACGQKQSQVAVAPVTENKNNSRLTMHRHLNDTIRYFERNFSNNFDEFYIEENVNIGSGGGGSTVGAGDFFLNDLYAFNGSDAGGGRQNGRSGSISNNNNHYSNNGGENFSYDNRKLYDVNGRKPSSSAQYQPAIHHQQQQSSKSIPINNKHHSGAEKIKKTNKKTIRECIDIDGLTRVDDRSYRKIIERDEKYQKEIVFLREQINKCKWFFNRLTTNQAWQDVQNGEFSPGDILADNNSQSEEIQSNCFSFSNDSVCSSWDEIDESDYKLASWVPDYYVTHCQGCNNKFSYRLRKHHCRNCGQVFCYKCADQFCPLPKYNLTAPVRVCHSCEIALEKQQTAVGNRPRPTASGGNHCHNGNSKSQYNVFSNSPSSLIFSSTPPFSDLLQPTNSIGQAAVSVNANSKLKLLNPIYSGHESSSNVSSSPSIQNRCNQNIDLNKFKKNGENKSSQKVSV